MRSTKDSPGAVVISHDDPVGQHGGAAGDRGPVAAGLADHRGRLAGDRRLVDGGDALDDVAVARDDLAGLDDHPVADAQRRCRAPAPRPRPGPSRRATVSVRVRRRLSACALPRPSATASARLANRTVSHSQTAISQANTLGSPLSLGDREPGDEHRADPDDEHHRVAQLGAGVELAQGVRAGTARAGAGRRRRRRPCDRCAARAAPGARRWSVPRRRSCECLRDGPEGQSREEGEGGDEHDGAADEHAEQRPGGGQRARRRVRRAAARRASRPARARPGSARTGRRAWPARAWTGRTGS